MEPIPETLSVKTKPKTVESADPAPRSRTIAHLLDNALPIPGTSIRVGIDPLLGFIPGIGDALSACFGFAILYDAARCKVRRWSQIKIATNVLINAIFGSVPIIGDLFSATFKSNARNYNILAKDLAEHQPGFTKDDLESPGFPWFAIGLIALVLLVLGLAAAGVFFLIKGML